LNFYRITYSPPPLGALKGAEARAEKGEHDARSTTTSRASREGRSGGRQRGREKTAPPPPDREQRGRRGWGMGNWGLGVGGWPIRVMQRVSAHLMELGLRCLQLCCQIYGPPSGRPIYRAGPGQSPRAAVSAHTRPGKRAVPARARNQPCRVGFGPG
jgi:hypothetical protein